MKISGIKVVLTESEQRCYSYMEKEYREEKGLGGIAVWTTELLIDECNIKFLKEALSITCGDVSNMPEQIKHCYYDFWHDLNNIIKDYDRMMGVL